jgi:hypothetical protein
MFCSATGEGTQKQSGEAANNVIFEVVPGIDEFYYNEVCVILVDEIYSHFLVAESWQALFRHVGCCYWPQWVSV